MAIDAACASSLAAINEACQSLRMGSCDLAIAGGVNIILSPDLMISLSRAHMLAPDGHCKTFDAKANGYARGEGCGIVVLKRLQDALRDQDNILAVIRGIEVNQDGSSSGLTVPNGQAQIRLMRQTLENAKVQANEVHYIEAHGTGTSLGDPIEVHSIEQVYSRPKEDPLIIGTVKSNIGHLESAAGVAGVIKTVLSLQHEEIPQNLNFSTLNPKIHLDQIPALIATTAMPWSRNQKPRLAGVSAFGFTGTIAHAIIEEAPPRETIQQEDRTEHLVTLSAKTEKGLRDLLNLYEKFLKEHPETDLGNLAYTTRIGRDHFKYRIALVAKDVKQLLEKIQQKDFLSGIVTDTHPVILTQDTPLQTLAENYIQGAEIDWRELDKPLRRQKVILPTYPFQRQRYWSKDATSSTTAQRFHQQNINQHPLLTHQIAAFAGNIFESEISTLWPDFMTDHLLYKVPVVAGAVWVSTVLSAAKIAYGDYDYILDNIEFSNPLFLNEKETYIVQTLIYPEEKGKRRFECLSRRKDLKQEETWTRHVQGYLKQGKQELNGTSDSLAEIQSRCPLACTKEYIYKFADDLGLGLTNHFCWIEHIHVGKDEALAKLRPPIGKEEEQGFILHPGLIDGFFQTMVGESVNDPKAFPFVAIPFSIRKMSYDARLGKPAWVHLISNYEKQENFIHIDLTILDEQGLPLGKITEFVARYAPLKSVMSLMKTSAPVVNNLYEISWKPSTLPLSGDSLKGTWIVFSDRSELSEQVCQLLTTQGCHCIQVSIPQNKEDFKSILKAITSETRGIILSLDTKSLLYFLQTLLEAKLQPPTLWLITQGIHPINSDVISVHQAPLLGLCKTALIEHSDLKIRQVDFDIDILAETLGQQLLKELLNIDEEDQVAYRKNIRYIPRLHRKDVKQIEPYPNVNPNGSYLITGGLGGLGLSFAQWLVSHGAKHIVLGGRHSPGEKEKTIIDQLKTQNVTVEIAIIDISNKQAVESLIRQFGQNWPQLKGVLHAAGIIDDGPLLNLDWNRFEKVLAPKLNGGWNLHQATLSKHLDFFVLFSSLTSVIGNPGQSSYAAANAFLDALAHLRHQQGLPAISIGWGPWAEVGMAAKFADRFHASGDTPLKLEEGLRAFEKALQLAKPHVLIANLNWKTFIQKQVRAVPWLSDIFARPKKSSDAISLLSKLQRENSEKQKEILSEYLRQLVNQIFGSSDNSMFPLDQNFFDSGMDSLMALELRNRLKSDLENHYDIPSTLIFNYTNVKSLTDYLVEIIDKESSSKQSNITQSIKSPVLVPLQIGGGNKLPLFCVHPLNGNVFDYSFLVKELGPEYPIMGLKHRGFEPNQALYSDAQDMLQEYLKAIRSVQNHGPYSFAGWSGGSNLSCSLAQQLEEEGEEINLVACIDFPNILGNDLFDNLSPRIFFDVMNKRLNTNIVVSDEEISTIDKQKLINLFFNKAQAQGAIPSELEFSEFERRYDILFNFLTIFKNYNLKRFKNVRHLLLFEAKRGMVESLGYTGRRERPIVDNPGIPEKYVFDCNHWEIIKSPAIISEIANIIRQYL